MKRLVVMLGLVFLLGVFSAFTQPQDTTATQPPATIQPQATPQQQIVAPPQNEADMLKLYGTRRSRTFRCLWTLEEASVPYDLIPIDFAKGESLQPDFLKINPNGKVPVLVDGDLVLFESLAINQHIAKRYAKQLWPSDDADQSLLCQWTTMIDQRGQITRMHNEP